MVDVLLGVGVVGIEVEDDLPLRDRFQELSLATEANAGLLVLVHRAAAGLGQELGDVLVVGLQASQRGERPVRGVVVLLVEEILTVAIERQLLEGQPFAVVQIAGQELTVSRSPSAPGRSSRSRASRVCAIRA